MIDDEWLLPEHIESGKINIELIMMYQSGVNILMDDSIDWDQNRYVGVRLNDQIKLRKKAVYNITRQHTIDWYDDELLHIHKHHLDILQRLRNQLTAQYN